MIGVKKWIFSLKTVLKKIYQQLYENYQFCKIKLIMDIKIKKKLSTEFEFFLIFLKPVNVKLRLDEPYLKNIFIFTQ